MKYRTGFKYQLAENETFITTFRPPADIITEFVCLYTDGIMLLKRGFASDGPSGPVRDREENMRGSFGHDALYRLMRKGLLDHNLWQQADENYGIWLKEAGSWDVTVDISMTGLAIAGGSAAHPDNINEIYEV